ncbi:hypothetical protein GGI1_24331 [Acidithiobacillus sp. GGI-221]|nr:hypothetical protein GGI1_24331 [Acidithiobacillus sp. GGI-221]
MLPLVAARNADDETEVAFHQAIASRNIPLLCAETQGDLLLRREQGVMADFLQIELYGVKMIGRPGFPGRVGYGVEFRRFGPEAGFVLSNLGYFFKGVWNVPVGILCQHGQSFALDSDRC